MQVDILFAVSLLPTSGDTGRPAIHRKRADYHITNCGLIISFEHAPGRAKKQPICLLLYVVVFLFIFKGFQPLDKY